MAPSHTLTAILSLLGLLLLLLISQPTLSLDSDDTDPDLYFLDGPSSSSLRTKSRFIANSIIKKGAHCDPYYNNVCNGVSANNGTAILNCCKTHCRNILGDRNNCGQCGQKCHFGQLCCHGKCTDIAYNVDHCGKCDNKCSTRVKCDYGVCGYA